jgi:hypothetical protein
LENAAPARKTPGGRVVYSDLAIETALSLRAVFRLALRQSEGLIASIMQMLAIDPRIPYYTTLGRRACGLPVHKRVRIETGDLHLIVDSTGLKLRGAGEWLFEKHGVLWGEWISSFAETESPNAEWLASRVRETMA